MRWLGWGLYAARRMSRGRRKQPFVYANLAMELISHYTARSAQKQQPTANTNSPHKTAPALSVPADFILEESWDWDESDRAYYRFATDNWTVRTFENWGVLELPTDKDGAHNFFGIVHINQRDDKGSLAHGARPDGDIDSALPVLLLFRLADGYNAAFAALQSWTLVQKIIEQDRLLIETGGPPRARL